MRSSLICHNLVSSLLLSSIAAADALPVIVLPSNLYKLPNFCPFITTIAPWSLLEPQLQLCTDTPKESNAPKEIRFFRNKGTYLTFVRILIAPSYILSSRLRSQPFCMMHYSPSEQNHHWTVHMSWTTPLGSCDKSNPNIISTHLNISSWQTYSENISFENCHARRVGFLLPVLL